MTANEQLEWPAIFYGTAWKREATAELTRAAISAGYRAIDTANQPRHYDEPGVGKGVARALDELSLARTALFLQTKFTPLPGQGETVPYDPDAPVPDQVAQSLESSLSHLGTDYLDAVLLHAPMTPQGMGDADWAAWRTLEAACRDGRARRIGISNAAAGHVRELLTQASIPPAVVQNRCFAQRRWDAEVRSVCGANGVAYQGFSLLTANPFVLDDQRIRQLAAAHEATPQQIVFAFARAVGMIPLTGTTDSRHMRDDLEALEIELDGEAVETVERVAG